MHPADAVYRFVKGLKPQIRLHVELQRPTTVNDAIRLAQAADSALYFTNRLPCQPANTFTSLPGTTTDATGCPDQTPTHRATAPPQRQPELPLPPTWTPCSRAHLNNHHASNTSLDTTAIQGLAGQAEHTSFGTDLR